jgi:cation transport ATPase
MKKYQPERTDLLINTEWGIPKEDLSSDEAQQRGLALFKDRWVSAEERKQLKRQRFTYRIIRVVALVFALAAGVMAVAFILNVSRKAPAGAVVMLGILVCVYVSTAVGLYAFKRWAYLVAMVAPMCIGIIQALIVRRLFYLVIAVLLVLLLIRKPVRTVFSTPKSEAGPS